MSIKKRTNFPKFEEPTWFWYISRALWIVLILGLFIIAYTEYAERFLR